MQKSGALFAEQPSPRLLGADMHAHWALLVQSNRLCMVTCAAKLLPRSSATLSIAWGLDATSEHGCLSADAGKGWEAEVTDMQVMDMQVLHATCIAGGGAASQQSAAAVPGCYAAAAPLHTRTAQRAERAAAKGRRCKRPSLPSAIALAISG